MLLELLMLIGSCESPSVRVFLGVTGTTPEASTRTSQDSVECDGCRPIEYSVLGIAGRILVPPEPALEISGEQIAKAWLAIERFPLQPERRYASLTVHPGAALSEAVDDLVERHYGEPNVVMWCGSVVSHGGVAASWRHRIPIGFFDTEKQAQQLADALGLTPKVIPFDAAQDEERRVVYIRAMLGDFWGQGEMGREQVRKTNPELYDFLERNPKYWALMEEPLP